MKLTAAAARLLALAALTVVTGCSAQQPYIDVKDLPLEYSTNEGYEPVLLGNCQGKSIVERYGQVVGGKSFEHDNGIDAINFVLVKPDHDQLWDRVVDAVNKCKSSFDASTGQDVILTTEVEVEPVDGPQVGDDTLWFETTVNIANNVTGADSSASRAVLARSGGYVVQLMASELDDDEKIELLRVALAH